jgi:polyketide biosynthesis enoyl-CoA hydratase PksH
VAGSQLASAVAIQARPGHLEARLTDAKRGNPLGPPLIDGLLAALDTAEADPACRALLISADGPAFCRGLDLDAIPADWFGQAGDMPVWRLFHRLRTASVITVALVDGTCTGGGVALAAACDLVIAGAGASFRFTEVLLGLVPAMAIPFVADRVGGQRAFRMAVTAAPVDAPAAGRTGLADTVCARAADGVRPLLVELRRLTPDTIAALKQMRTELFPRPAGTGELAARASLDRLADPGVQAHQDRLRQAGLL